MNQCNALQENKKKISVLCTADAGYRCMATGRLEFWKRRPLVAFGVLFCGNAGSIVFTGRAGRG